jgi:DNA-binding CsgD family transcriptional regulator
MTPEQIRAIVKATIEELLKSRYIRADSYQLILDSLEPKLYGFFKDGKSNKEVARPLKLLASDPYIKVIYLIYRNHKTLEEIAESLDKDVSTIKRNKKRLLYKIFELLEV